MERVSGGPTGGDSHPPSPLKYKEGSSSEEVDLIGQATSSLKTPLIKIYTNLRISARR